MSKAMKVNINGTKRAGYGRWTLPLFMFLLFHLDINITWDKIIVKMYLPNIYSNKYPFAQLYNP